MGCILTMQLTVKLCLVASLVTIQAAADVTANITAISPVWQGMDLGARQEVKVRHRDVLSFEL